MIAVSPESLDVLALRRIVEVGKARVVELQVGAPERAERLDLVGVHLLQVAPEFFDVGVDRGVDCGPAAAIVDHARRRDRQLRCRLGHRPEKREVVGEDALLELQLAGHPHGRRRELDVALFVVELHLQVVVRLGNAANLIDEVHVPGRAAVLAVGHPLESDILLHPDDRADGRVLDPALVLGRNPALRVVIPGLEHLGRAQQAANVVGAKRGNRVHAEMPRSEEPSIRFNHILATSVATISGLACKVVACYGSVH